MIEENEADRYLLAALRGDRQLNDRYPEEEKWHWRYAPVPRDPFSPDTRSENPMEAKLWTTSLARLAELGWVWRGAIEVRDTRQIIYRGWGLTVPGQRRRREIRKSEEFAKWQRIEKVGMKLRNEFARW